MDEIRPKDPVRVRAGRLGALTVHMKGRTNTAPARAAWLATLASEVDPNRTLDASELERRVQFALQARMIRLNAARWSGKTPRRGAPEAA